MKESFAEKMARKAFEDPKFQQSWRVHMGAFGPVLESAFRGDWAAKIHLCAALNHISRRESRQGMDKLQELEKHVRTDTDRAALSFFRGVCCQMGGDETGMICHYRDAAELEIRFYMPYMKLAKVYQGWLRYDQAARYYRGAIACYDGMGLGAGERVILGSAYTGLATCLTMMHRYSDAERALETSRTICPDGPGRSAVEAILYAAMGREAEAEAALKVLLTHAPQVYEQTRASVRGILSGADPIFCEHEPKGEQLEGFWAWFREHEAVLTPEELTEQVNGLFPQAEGNLEVHMEGSRIILPDHYIRSLTRLYRELSDRCPEELKGRWELEIVHYHT